MIKEYIPPTHFPHPHIESEEKLHELMVLKDFLAVHFMTRPHISHLRLQSYQLLLHENCHLPRHHVFRYDGNQFVLYQR